MCKTSKLAQVEAQPEEEQFLGTLEQSPVTENPWEVTLTVNGLPVVFEKSHEPDDKKSHEPDDKKSHEPDDKKSHEPDDKRSHEPDDKKSHEPDDKRSHEPDDKKSHEPGDKRSHEPDDKKSHEPDDEKSHEPDDKKSHEPDDKKSHEPDDKRSHEPDDKKSHEPDKKRSHEPDDKKSHEPDDEKSHEPDDKKSHESDDEKSHEPDDEKSHEPDDEKSHEPDDEKSHEPDDEKSHEPDDKKSEDPYLAMLIYRSTPLQNGSSPSELLMNRHLRTNLPITEAQLKPQIPDYTAIHTKEEKQRKKQKEIFDSRYATRALDLLFPGEEVWVQDHNTPGRVVELIAPRSYHVSIPTGLIRRNRSHLRRIPNDNETVVNSQPSNEQPVRDSNSVETRSGRISKPPTRWSPGENT